MSGIFVSVSSLPQQYLVDLADHIRSHRCITEVVYTDVQPWQWPSIDFAGLAVARTYIGAVEVSWYGPRSDTPTDLQPWMVPVAGVAGMLTPSYRWDQIRRDMEIFVGAAERGADFYIRSEVGIDALGDHARVRQAWEWYLIELCRQAFALRPHARLLWSPYAWDAWATVSPLRRGRIAAALKTLVTNVRTYSGTPGITTIDLQDGRGVQPVEPETDAVNWWNLIKGCGAEVRINAEWFTPDLQPQDRDEMAKRLDYYRAAGVPIGCCWEARYWLVPLLQNH